MRFKTENEGLEHIRGKKIKDPKNYNAEKQTPDSIDGCRLHFDEWLERKKFMFAPEEMIALMGKDHRGRKGPKNQAMRDHHINTFIDWAEERPRCRAIIIINANQKASAIAIAKQVDLVGGDQTFSGLGLSPTGEEPATHYWCGWNCSASEYDFFESQNMPWWNVYESLDEDAGAIILETQGLKVIQSPEEEIGALEVVE